MSRSKKPVVRFKDLAIREIEHASDLQTRAATSAEVIAEYAERLREGIELGAPVVYFDGQKNWLSDGFHRLGAHEAINRRKVRCEVRAGSRTDAIVNGIEANAKHGLRRNHDDKRRNVLMLLAIPEFAKLSNHDLAKRAFVSHTFVAQVKAASGKPFPDARTVTRGGATYEVDTSGIAESNRERAEERRARENAGKLTPDAAPGHKSPRVTREGAQDDPGDDLPVVRRDAEEYEDDRDESTGGELVEDGALAEQQVQPAGKVPRDANGTPVPAHLLVVWDLLTFKNASDTIDHTIEQLAAASAAWESFQARMLEHVREAGTDANLPTRELPSLDNDFGPNGRVRSMVAALWRMVPHVVCDACEGAGCGRCGHLGWFSRADWRERCRVDGILDDAGVEG